MPSRLPESPPPALIVDLVIQRILQVYERHTLHAGESHRRSQVEVRRVSASAFQGDNERSFALHRFIRKLGTTRLTAEQCEMCAAPLAGVQRHLLDLAHHTFLSICTVCALAFGPRGANAGLYRLIPTRHLALLDFQATDELWAGPVKMICLLRNSETGSVLAVYLAPPGVRESVFDLDRWKTLRTANPLLESLEPDVETLLLQRIGPAPAAYIVPIDTCARLIGLLEDRRWNQEGERAIWQAVGAFFADLQASASPAITVNVRECGPGGEGEQGPAAGKDVR